MKERCGISDNAHVFNRLRWTHLGVGLARATRTFCVISFEITKKVYWEDTQRTRGRISVRGDQLALPGWDDKMVYMLKIIW